MNELIIREAQPKDTDIIYDFIKGLAIYEKLLDEFIATKEDLLKTIFKLKQANVLIGFEFDSKQQTETPVCFALYFYNYSTFLAKAGIYFITLPNIITSIYLEIEGEIRRRVSKQTYHLFP